MPTNDRTPSLEQDLIWLRPHRAPRGPRPALGREEITRAAIELADADGLRAVSMRRIAAKLGTGATPLYWYVSSKEDLYELMADEVIREIRLPELASRDWRADLRTFARNTHAVLRRHPWTVLLGIQPGLGPKAQQYAQAAMGVFGGLGLDATTQINTLAALNNYIFGFVHREIAWDQLRQRSGLTEKQWMARLRNYLEQAAHRDPNLAQRMAVRLGATQRPELRIRPGVHLGWHRRPGFAPEAAPQERGLCPLRLSTGSPRDGRVLGAEVGSEKQVQPWDGTRGRTRRPPDPCRVSGYCTRAGELLTVRDCPADPTMW